MTADREWLERADWGRRAAELGELRAQTFDGEAIVAMELAPAGSRGAREADALWRLWRGLKPCRYILEPVELHWLRYAALDWQRAPFAITADGEAAAAAATCGAKLTWVAEHVRRMVAADSLGWLASPRVWFDLEGDIRVAFVADDRGAASRLPPEVVKRWPYCDERGLVFVVGRALRELIADELAPDAPVARVIERCVAGEPAERFATLQALRDALRLAGGQRVQAPRQRQRLVWDQLEQGIGYLALAQPTNALLRFEAALALDPKSARARALRDDAVTRGIDVRVASASRFELFLAWTDVAPEALALERVHDHGSALYLYEHVRSEDADLVEVVLGSARCHLRLGALQDAVDRAERALRRAPGQPEAHAIRLDALLRGGQHPQALDAADAWIAATLDDGAAYHARGRSLLALGHPAEAREAFERACLLSPAMIEPMLLRREADRMLRGVRAAVGAAAAMSLAIPDHLAGLRDVLANGRAAEGIRWLARAEHAGDPVAQLMRAHLLVFDGRVDDALPIFDAAAQLDRAQAHVALVGKARALLELGRAADALAICEQLTLERPDLGEAIDCGARALKQLGRDAEAEAAFRHYLAITAHGSELRVRGSRGGPRS